MITENNTEGIKITTATEITTAAGLDAALADVTREALSQLRAEIAEVSGSDYIELDVYGRSVYATSHSGGSHTAPGTSTPTVRAFIHDHDISLPVASVDIHGQLQVGSTGATSTTITAAITLGLHAHNPADGSVLASETVAASVAPVTDEMLARTITSCALSAFGAIAR